jgi:hypothetical protein
MLSVPKVRISGSMRKRLTSVPWTTPTTAPKATMAASTGSSSSERPSLKAQLSTTARPSSWPTERSIRPPAMTKVWPIATRPSAADWVTTFARLVGVAKPGTNSSAATSTTASSP